MCLSEAETHCPPLHHWVFRVLIEFTLGITELLLARRGHICMRKVSLKSGEVVIIAADILFALQRAHISGAVFPRVCGFRDGGMPGQTEKKQKQPL